MAIFGTMIYNFQGLKMVCANSREGDDEEVKGILIAEVMELFGSFIMK
jgi:hypothetical protein